MAMMLSNVFAQMQVQNADYQNAMAIRAGYAAPFSGSMGDLSTTFSMQQMRNNMFGAQFPGQNIYWGGNQLLGPMMMGGGADVMSPMMMNLMMRQALQQQAPTSYYAPQGYRQPFWRTNSSTGLPALPYTSSRRQLGGLSSRDFAPLANPNVQIPNFGRNADKAQVGQMLDAASNKYGIPPNILKAVAWQESGWNPRALSAGQHEKGVMQIDDRYHAFARSADAFDPAQNIDYGARYLAEKYRETGSWEGALKRYNGGNAYPPKVLALAEQQPWHNRGLA